MVTPAGPYHRYSTELFLTGSQELTLFDFTQFGTPYFVLEGLDLLNFDLAVGARAIVSMTMSGPDAGSFPFFQGITYASSQACFQWRGSRVVFPPNTLTATSDSGEWYVHAFGYVEPGYTGFP